MHGRFIHTVRQTIACHSLLKRQGRVIVAVSGGADSLALLSVLLKLGYDCVAAHCNFHLRGDESDRDERHVEAVAEQLGAELRVKHFDVPARMAATGESVEMACRELRYAWFHDLLDCEHGQAIAVGHHADDNVETFFLNLLRGSGVAGLSAMRYRNGAIVRPLLDTTRVMTEAYLRDEGIGFVTDSTNASDCFKRNRLRNRVLPLLEELFPGTADAITRSIAHLDANRRIYERAVARDAAPYCDGDCIRLAEMVDADPEARTLMFEMLHPRGFNISQVDDMLDAVARNRSGLIFHNALGEHCELDRGVLHISSDYGKQSPDAYDVSIGGCGISEPVKIAVSCHDVAAFNPARDGNILYMDERVLDGSPVWQLRRWRQGDRIAPYGMRGTKLVSDIFAEARLPAFRKRDTWLLTRDGEILWVVGIRGSSLFNITSETKRYIKLQLINR